MLDIFSPLIVIWYLVKLGELSRAPNSIKNGKPPSGIKRGGYRIDFNINDMKKYCRAKNTTVNDHTAAILSQTMHDYFKEKGEGGVVPKSINIGVPFSLRRPTKEIKNIKMNNDFASLALSLEIH